MCNCDASGGENCPKPALGYFWNVKKNVIPINEKQINKILNDNTDREKDLKPQRKKAKSINYTYDSHLILDSSHMPKSAIQRLRVSLNFLIVLSTVLPVIS